MDRLRVKWAVRTRLSLLAHHPFEVFLGVVALLSGISYASGAPRPGTVDASFPSWFLSIWGVYLIVGGGLVLLGTLTAVRLFTSGLFLLAGGISVYAAALFHESGIVPGVFLAANIDLALAVACLISAIVEVRSWTRR